MLIKEIRMIEINNLTKRFDNIVAVNRFSLSIEEGKCTCIVGKKSAGKSTIMRMLSGVIKQDSGTIVVDDMPIYNNVATKVRMYFVPEEIYFFAGASAYKMADYIKTVYPEFDRAKFDGLLGTFGIDGKKRIKGNDYNVKACTSVALALSAGVKYVLLDETLDKLGSDTCKQVVAELKKEKANNLTLIVASENEKQFEDLCDNVKYLNED